uniref:Uncharacterized protein n=1 Tax=Anguilla anguilla TaxID=7936 RepID=A0A0E9PY66_ANGAN
MALWSIQIISKCITCPKYKKKYISPLVIL